MELKVTRWRFTSSGFGWSVKLIGNFRLLQRINIPRRPFRESESAKMVSPLVCTVLAGFNILVLLTCAGLVYHFVFDRKRSVDRNLLSMFVTGACFVSAYLVIYRLRLAPPDTVSPWTMFAVTIFKDIAGSLTTLTYARLSLTRLGVLVGITVTAWVNRASHYGLWGLYVVTNVVSISMEVVGALVFGLDDTRTVKINSLAHLLLGLWNLTLAVFEIGVTVILAMKLVPAVRHADHRGGAQHHAAGHRPVAAGGGCGARVAAQPHRVRVAAARHGGHHGHHRREAALQGRRALVGPCLPS